jgi:cobalamin biosynthesis protein CobD/CbiB
MNRFERWSLWVSAALASVSGIGLFWLKYLVTSDDPWAVINHPLQPWFLKVHVVATPLLVFALGLVTTRHIWHHWRNGNGRGRTSGAGTALLTVPMVLTGYLIQAVTHVGLLRALAISHIALGILFAIGFALHQMMTVGRAADEADRPGRRVWSAAEVERKARVRAPSVGMEQ